MEGSNYWGYGYKTQHSSPRSRLITWRRPEVKFGRNEVKKKQHKNYQDEDKKSAINKRLILRLRSLISKWFQLKTTNNIHFACIRFHYQKNAAIFILEKKLFLIISVALIYYISVDWRCFKIHRLLLYRGVRLPQRVCCYPVGWGCKIHRLLLCIGVRPLPPRRVS